MNIQVLIANTFNLMLRDKILSFHDLLDIGIISHLIYREQPSLVSAFQIEPQINTISSWQVHVQLEA